MTDLLDFFFLHWKLISIFSVCVRVVKAGTELTWDYSTHVEQKQEVPCLCGSKDCTGHFAIEEKLCEMCEAEAQ